MEIAAAYPLQPLKYEPHLPELALVKHVPRSVSVRGGCDYAPNEERKRSPLAYPGNLHGVRQMTNVRSFLHNSPSS